MFSLLFSKIKNVFNILLTLDYFYLTKHNNKVIVNPSIYTNLTCGKNEYYKTLAF